MYLKYLNRILNLENQKLIGKYTLISVISYLYVFISLYLLIDVFTFNKSLSFVIVYAIAYLFLYTVQLKYLFKKKHNSYKLIKYIISIVFFYLSANVFYNIGLYLNINYLLSTVFTIIILMPLRLIVYKYYVYKN